MAGDDDAAAQARLLDLSAPLLQRFRAHPSIPTELSGDSLGEILMAAAPVVLAIFGSPEAAASVLDDQFARLFERMDAVDESLERIEASIKALEAKHDAAVLAKFKSGMRELRDGLGARRKAFREQLLLGARTKLTELCELPPGLHYGSFPSHMIAAAASLLVAMIDTWYGEIESSHRYELKALIADPIWAEEYLGRPFIDAIAGAELRTLEEDLDHRVQAERAKVHDFFWHKVGAGALGALGVVLNPGGTGVHVANAGRLINKYGTEEAQDEARNEAIKKVEQQGCEQRATLLRDAASCRLRAIE